MKSNSAASRDFEHSSEGVLASDSQGSGSKVSRLYRRGRRLGENSLVRQGISALLVKVSAAGLSYFMFAALARWLSPSQYGQYGAAFSAGTFLSFVVLMGLNNAVLRSTPHTSGSEGTSSPALHFISAMRALLYSCLTAGALGCSLSFVISIWGSGGTSSTILIATGFGLSLATAEFLSAALRASGSVHLALLPRDVLWRVLVIIVVALAILEDWRPSMSAAAAYSIVLLLVALLFQLVAGWSRFRILCTSRRRTRAATTLWQSRYLALVGVAANILQPLSVVVVGGTLAFEQSGGFFAAQKTAALLSLPLIAMNTIGAPTLARSWRAGDAKSTQRTCLLISVTSGAATLAGFVLILLLAGPLMGVYDQAYVVLAHILVVLAASSLINALSGPTLVLMAMTGHERQLVVLLAVGQGVGLLLVLILGSTWQITGAAWGVFAGTLLYNGLIVAWCRKMIGIDPSLLALMRRRK